MKARKPTGKEPQWSKDQSLCWDCVNATCPENCEWVDRFEPVKGWWARPRVIRRFGHSKEEIALIDSYSVVMCPKFKRNSWRGGTENDWRADIEKRTMDNSDVKSLASAIICQAVIDWESTQRGRFKRFIVSDGKNVKAEEILEFFFSGYFEHLLQAVTSVDPDVVREELGIFPWMKKEA